MKERVYNFAAGPSMLPLEVINELKEELPLYGETGMAVMEMSHRSKQYLEVFNETKNDLKELLKVPDDYEILFLQGGASLQFAMVPLNIMTTGKADYVITGNFAKKAAEEAARFGDVCVVYDDKPNGYDRIPQPSELKFREDASYVHICANNTIYGTQWKYIPETGSIPLVADMSSEILSKPVDVSHYGIIYAGAQKNMGIAGLTVVIIRKDLLNRQQDRVPVMLQYGVHAKADSMYNTPPTHAIYVLGKVLKWLKRQGGLEAMAVRSEKKAAILYDLLDHSDFYKPHAAKEARSLMNVTFNCPTAELEEKFVQEAKKAGIINIKGHRLVGGLRASIYNAMPIEGVERLAEFMQKFQEENR